MSSQNKKPFRFWFDIAIDARPGAGIETAIKDAIKIADLAGPNRVVLRFNEVELDIEPDASWTVMEERFQRRIREGTVVA